MKVLFHAQPVTKDWNKANKNMTYFLSQNKPFPLQYLLFIERRIAEFNDCSYKSLWHEVESQSHDLSYTSLGDLIDFLGCSLHFNDFVTCTFSLFEPVEVGSTAVEIIFVPSIFFFQWKGTYTLVQRPCTILVFTLKIWL